jgi:DNA-binding MarR family transcriptional regulator
VDPFPHEFQLPRQHTRRGGPKRYIVDRASNDGVTQLRGETAPPDVQMLLASGEMHSSLRKALRSQGIDPKMARLVLLFYEWKELRVREVAWKLNVSPSTASRHLDRAEQLGLVDKFYDTVFDRRATSARLTERGRALRLQVERTLALCKPYRANYGPAYGRRIATKEYKLDLGYA